MCVEKSRITKQGEEVKKDIVTRLESVPPLQKKEKKGKIEEDSS